jgi:hypothetical protein
MTWLFVAAALGLGLCAYRLALLLQDEREKHEPRNPQVREAMAKVMAKAPVREPIRTQDGDPKRHHQHRVLQMGPKKVSGL